MKLGDILIPTSTAKAGMKVRDAFKLCVDANVPAVPFLDISGTATGYISFLGVMHRGCLPNYIVELAHVLGNNLSCVTNAEEKVKEVMESPIESYIDKPIRSLTSDAQVIKGLATLEKYRTGYLFVFDGDEYRGVVTASGIARRMIAVDAENPAEQIITNCSET